MADPLPHLLLFSLACPASLFGYHLYAGAHSEIGERGVVEEAQRVGSTAGYRLARLEVLQRDLLYVENRYVEEQRLDPAAMFDAALDAVERAVPEVMFQREPGGRMLHVSVGRSSTVLVVEPVRSFQDLSARLVEVATVLDEHLSDDVSRPEVEYAFVNGVLSTLDPHTVLLPPEEAREMDVDNEGEFGGLGIEITIVDNTLVIKQPLEGTPAAAAGLQSDDRITRIEDESTINMDLSDAVTRLRGPVGRPVTITVMRKGFDAPRPFTVVRDLIRLNPVEGTLLPGDVAYVRIKNFNANVASDLDRLLTGFHSAAAGGLRGLILDLRANPGGYLNQAVEVSDRFLDSGVIVSTVEGGASGRRDERRASGPGTEPDYPVAVLVNGSSASASEIVAGALRNHERAVIIGERTFGKGSVQHLFANEDESRLKLTVAKYLTPGDESIQSVGIPPDIQLQPSVIRPAEKAGDSPLISLYWWQWGTREADLDHHLERVATAEERPSYSVRYLRPARDSDAETPRPQDDREVGFAREILLASRGARRAEVLASAADVVARIQQRESAQVAAAFQQLGLDWSAGKNPAQPNLTARLVVGSGDALRVGQDETLTLELRNQGSEPLHQISAVITSDNFALDHREFYFGAIAPGALGRFTIPVTLPDGYGTEDSEVSVSVRDPNGELFSQEQLLRAEGVPLPRFRYSLRFFDDGSGTSRGDGDGVPEPGEVIDLELQVTNVGQGPSREGFARLKNQSGKGLDLRVGSAELGQPRDEAGAACQPSADGCLLRLNVGETATSRLSFELREQPAGGAWGLDLLVGDNRAYDYGTVQRAGFGDYFQLSQSLSLRAGEAMPPVTGEPPAIELTRRPGVQSEQGEVVLSGRVTDDHGLRDVIIFRGEDKIFFEGGGGELLSLPFTVETALEPGSNSFTVLARDRDGLSSSTSFTSWLPQPRELSHAEPARQDAPL